MALDVRQQVIQSIERNSRILVVPHRDFEADIFSSALALTSVLRKIGKHADFIFSYPLPQKFSYLNEYEFLERPARLSGDFIIAVQVGERRVKELRYQREGDLLKIYLTPETEPVKDSDISCEGTADNYDLVITLGCPDLESMGELFEQHPHLFFNRPVINIDRSPHNEEFAEINFIDVTSAALTEMMTELLEIWKHEHIDERVATILLTGLIAGTNNFRSHATTPKTLSKAAYLITRGGNHQTIIQHLYKTKTLTALKLLGKLMSKAEYFEGVGLSWSQLDGEDLRATGNTTADIALIVEEFREQFPQLEVIAIALTNGEGEKRAKILIHSLRRHLLNILHKDFGGEVRLNKMLIETQGESLDMVRDRIVHLLKRA